MNDDGTRPTEMNRRLSRGALIRCAAAKHRPNGIGGPNGPVSCSCGRYTGANEGFWWSHFADELDAVLRRRPIRGVVARIGHALIRWANR